MLESKIREEDRSRIKDRITSPESVDLIEDGFIQASRALSEERKEHIASLLKNSLTDEDLQHIEYKRLLSLLGELSDLEVLILKSHIMYDDGKDGYEEFWGTHKDALTSPLAEFGSPQEEIDKQTIFQTHNGHLVNLGLLKIKIQRPLRGEAPKFDNETGMIQAQGYAITGLGWLLLRSIDQGVIKNEQ